jgi:hypothetical protein
MSTGWLCSDQDGTLDELNTSISIGGAERLEGMALL